MPEPAEGMTQRQRVLRRWVIGYVLVLLGSLPFALSLWTGFLRDSLGRFVSIQQIHLLQYAGLGGLASMYVRAGPRTAGTWGLCVGLLVGLSLCDESIQWLLPNRYFDWLDVGLNIAGGLGGMILSPAVAWGVRRRTAR